MAHGHARKGSVARRARGEACDAVEAAALCSGTVRDCLVVVVLACTRRRDGALRDDVEQQCRSLGV